MPRKRMITLLTVAALVTAAGAAEDLERGFAQPPASARPWVYWFPLSGNLTKEGITADLEAMQRVGVGGALYMEVDQGAPKGPADFAGPLWRELFQHACREADRLGLELNMNNDAGWCGQSSVDGPGQGVRLDAYRQLGSRFAELDAADARGVSAAARLRSVAAAARVHRPGGGQPGSVRAVPLGLAADGVGPDCRELRGPPPR